MGDTQDLTQALAAWLPQNQDQQGGGGKGWNPTVIKSQLPNLNSPTDVPLSQKAENHRLNDYQVPWSCTSLGGQNQSFSGFLPGEQRDTCPGTMFPTHCFLCKRNYHIDRTPCPSHWVDGELLAVFFKATNEFHLSVVTWRNVWDKVHVLTWKNLGD